MDDRGFERINIIPLVDVMLVLLTIVLTTSTFIATGTIPVHLPQAANSSEEIFEAVIIEIDKFGSIFLNSKRVDLHVLHYDLAALSRQKPILIRADKSIALQQFVDVMDAVKGLGFMKVSLQTEAAS